MEIHQLAYFVEVAREGNFTRAAGHCNVTQPTLSHQIRKLESELGEPLFQRSRKGAVLTPMSESFLPRAQLILREVEAAKEDAESYLKLSRGCLKIGAIPTVAPYLLPGLVSRTTEAYPNFSVEIREETTEDILGLLQSGDLDFALASPPFENSEKLSYMELCKDELKIAMPKEHPMARETSVYIEDLTDHPLVLMKEAHCLSRQSLDVCEKRGFPARVAIRSSQLDTVVGLVQSGLGLSFVPSMACDSFLHRDIVFVSIAPEPVYRGIGLVWLKQHHPTRAQKAFMDICCEINVFGTA